MKDSLKNKKISDEELEMVSGGHSGDDIGSWIVYCAGVGPFNPGCGYEQGAANERIARRILRDNNRCPTCKTGHLDVKQKNGSE